jgi:dolichol kinase
MLPGLIPFIMWFIYHEDPLPAWNLGVVVAVVAVLTLIGISYAHASRRERHENWSRTCLTYVVGPLLILILFPGNAEYAATVLTILAFGDSAAALGGRLFGKKCLGWNQDKTYMGLFCFIIFAAPLGSLAYWGEANPEVSLAMVMVCGTSAAVLAGLAESLRSRIDDNLRVSGGAAVGVIVSSWILVPAV